MKLVDIDQMFPDIVKPSTFVYYTIYWSRSTNLLLLNYLD